jgi:hypothetical protein
MSSRNKKRMRIGVALNACAAVIGFVGGAITGLTVLYAIGALEILMTASSLWVYLRAPLLPDSL